MSTDLPPAGDPSGFAEFLADYFVECDEHLSIARRSLLTLERSLEQSKVDRPLLDELFRSFHSLKGLSAMVGFQEAELVAHHVETFLGMVRSGRLQLDLAGLETLIEAVATLEKVIAARRDAVEPPDTSDLLGRIGVCCRLKPGRKSGASTSPATPPLDEKLQLIAEKLRRGDRAWQVIFAPSAALVARGVDVNAVRQKLQVLGEIVHSMPLIATGGRIEFCFILTSAAPEEQVAALAGDGLTLAPYQPPVAATAESSVTATAKPGDEGSSTHLTPANVVRVDLERLDELMRMVGELVLSRARLEDGLRRLENVAPAGELRPLRETSSAIERQLRDLREGVMRVRMVPVREVFARMKFVVRDLIRELAKQVALTFSGEETQIDKYVVERIMDPLLHLVRNAVSHGLELPEERLAAGKPSTGNLHLLAKATGETVVIEVQDDGRGIDAASVLEQARRRGFEFPRETLDSASLLDVLCIPGFSTRERSDRVSGRGIGMDVVRSAVEELGGSLTMQTSRGQGARFAIQLPLTLAITDALIVKVGNERFAVPQIAVREIIRIEPGSSTLIENNELFLYRQSALPLLRLSRLFGTVTSRDGEQFALVVGSGAQGIAVVVDRVLGLREIVVRSLTDRLVQVPGISGATELGDGKVVLILDTASLARIVQNGAGGTGAVVHGCSRIDFRGTGSASCRLILAPSRSSYSNSQVRPMPCPVRRFSKWKWWSTSLPYRTRRRLWMELYLCAVRWCPWSI